ncbi:MAG TPA: family 16 glycoside hydrolase [Bryobacteraceae bacterium]
MTALGLSAADDGWVDLFDGRSLNGWRPSENQASWKVVDGALSAEGPRSHLFYTGPVHGANFRNFELEVEVMTRPLCNSGVYFHTAFQETGFPVKGFEVQIANTHLGDGGYRERKKTGSLYGVRNVYKQLVPDGEWFRMNVQVRGKNVQIRLNGTLLVDYIEPTPPVIPDGPETGRFLDKGTFALQCHNDGSKARFRSVRVRTLPDNVATAGGPAPVADDVFKQIINVGRHNIPMVDFHVHLKSGLTLEQALAKSRRDGIQYGIAVNCGKGFPIENDDGVRQFAESMKGQPIFVAMQAEGREWTQMFSRRVAALFDYVFTDSMTWTDNHGKRMRLWIPEEVGTIADPQEFMDTLVDRAVGILDHEPIDIYVNPTFLPDVLAKDYEILWTEARRKKVIDAAVRNGIAMELNNRYKLPSPSFVRMAKAAGCKFTFGTNNAGPEDLGRCEYGLRLVEECKLVWQDFFVPLAGPKAVERRGSALRA